MQRFEAFELIYLQFNIVKEDQFSIVITYHYLFVNEYFYFPAVVEM